MIGKQAFKFLNLQTQLSRQFSRVNHFNDFKQSKTFLDTTKPRFAVLYFRASWNPLCEQSDKHFQQLSDQHLEYSFVQIDVDKAPQAKGYFAVKCEPEFLVLCLGQEMTRQTGVNLQRLQDRLVTVREYVGSLKFFQGTEKYEEFHEQYMSEHQQFDQQIDEWAR